MTELVAGTVIKNPDNPEQTFTVGQRGRRPAWLMDYIAKQEVDLPVSQTQVKATTSKKTEFQSWIWNNDGFMKDKIIIVAKDEFSAITLGTHSFSYPITLNELKSEFWRVESYEGDLAQGVYTWDRATETWLPYVSKHKITI